MCPLPQNIKAMLSIPWKPALPTGALKQNFWGNIFSISGTEGTKKKTKKKTCFSFGNMFPILKKKGFFF